MWRAASLNLKIPESARASGLGSVGFLRRSFHDCFGEAMGLFVGILSILLILLCYLVLFVLLIVLRSMLCNAFAPDGCAVLPNKLFYPIANKLYDWQCIMVWETILFKFNSLSMQNNQAWL